MRTLALCTVAAAFALAATPAISADGDGKFMIKGVGAKTCEDLLRGNGVTHEQLDTFLDGFVTAMNIQRADSYDIVPGAEWPRVMEGMVAYCGENREASLAIAALRMIEYYFPRRIKHAPSR
jgi:hypothetical protein